MTWAEFCNYFENNEDELFSVAGDAIFCYWSGDWNIGFTGYLYDSEGVMVNPSDKIIPGARYVRMVG
jgi:hypothetical protein